MNDEKSIFIAKSSEFDGFSELLAILNFDVDIFHNAKICGNWQVHEHAPPGMTCFHMVTMGSCQLDVPGHTSQILYRGDLIIFPREIPHTISGLSNQTGLQRHCDFLDDNANNGTGLLCGEVRFQHKSCHVILDALPVVLIIPYMESAEWSDNLLQMILKENHQHNPGAKIITNKLAELVFSYALREYLSTQTKHIGMLALFSDSRLVEVIALIHKEPEKNWTLDKLAKQATMSRSTFSTHFKKLSGWSPGEYLSWWRMQVAWKKLKEGISVAEAAEQVGYQSEAAFSRVFKKTFNVSAGKVRRNQDIS